MTNDANQVTVGQQGGFQAAHMHTLDASHCQYTPTDLYPIQFHYITTHPIMYISLYIYSNAPFRQSCDNDVFREYLGECAVIYIDDLAIYSNTREDHLRHIRSIFQTMRNNQIYTKQS